MTTPEVRERDGSTRPGAPPSVGPRSHLALPPDLAETVPARPIMRSGALSGDADTPDIHHTARSDRPGAIDPEEIRAGEALSTVAPDRYMPRGPLGEGGIGRVDRVFDQHLEREIAVKVLHRIPDDPIERAVVESRFLDEARVTGRLEHPGVVPVYDVGRQPDGTPYYAMKQVEGRTLRAALEDADLNARMRLLPRLSAVCQTIAYAHRHGVIHRDLKPDNIMLGDFGETLVVDWGLAKLRGETEPPRASVTDLHRMGIADRTRDGQVLGTPAYMAPEQARGDALDLDERTDVWALGVMLYELIVGKVPFMAGDFDRLVWRIENQTLAPVTSLVPACPPALAAIAEKALARDPVDRYADAAAMAADLQRFQEGGLVLAHDYTRGERMWRFMRRHRIGLAFGLSLALVALAGWGWRGAREAKAEQARRVAIGAEIQTLVEQARTTRPAGWLGLYGSRLAALTARRAALSTDPDDSAVSLEPLVALLVDDDRAMRRLGARALGLTGRDAAVDPLIARLGKGVEDDEAVLIDVIRALGVLGDERAHKPVHTARMRYGSASQVGHSTSAAARMIPTPLPGPDARASDWVTYGISMVGKRRLLEAVDAYTNALELDPGYFRARNNRGLVMRRLARYGDALVDFDQALATQTSARSREMTLLNRSVVHRYRYDFAAAMSDADEVINAGTGRLIHPARRNRARIRWYAGDMAGARTDLDPVLAALPDDRQTLHLDALWWAATGQYEAALERLNRAAALDPDLPLIYRHRAQVHRARGDRASMRSDLDRAVTLDPTLYEGRAERLTALVEMGEEALAMTEEAALFENHPATAAVFAATGVRIHARRGDWATAAERLDRAIARAMPGERALLVLIRRAIGTRFDDADGPALEPVGEVLWHDRMLAIARGADDPTALAAEVTEPGQRCTLRLAVAIRGRSTRGDGPLPPATGFSARLAALPDLACEAVDALGMPR